MKEPSVRVGIMNEKVISFELHGEFTATGSQEKFSGKYTARHDSNLIEISDDGNTFRKKDEIEFFPIDSMNSFFLLKNVTIGIGFHWEQKEDQQFRGSLKFIAAHNTMVAINTLPVEA